MTFDTETKTYQFPYEINRRTLLSAIFTENVQLSKELDPFAYEDDIYDWSLDTYYALAFGGKVGKDRAEQAIDELETIKEEFADDKEIITLCEELAEDYQQYIVYFSEVTEKESA
jgi:hypothetical protein